MNQYLNQPWYIYVIIGLGLATYVIRYALKAKEGYHEAKPDVLFKKAANSSLSPAQLFAIALYTPIAEWWKANTNTLTYRDAKTVQPYLEGWGMTDAAGYWNLTNYFMQDGRRWYFDSIQNMIQNEPPEQWNEIMQEQFGPNERAERYLDLLKSGKSLEKLKQKGILQFDSDLNLGVAGYDAAVLVGQARKAFTGNIISEEEAWKVIQFARDLAVREFNSWEDFAKSFAIGFELDMKSAYDEYKEDIFDILPEVLQRPDSPWNQIAWPNQ